MHRGVALGGFMGVGKSTVGRALADRLALPFIDLDAVLEAAHGPIARQIAAEGEATFRQRERDAILRVVDGAPCVLATGGGAWVDPANRAALRRAFHLVVLDAPLATLARRVAGDPARPLWDDAVEARYAARRSAYADADLRVDTGVGDASTAVEEIVKWLQPAP